MAEKDNNRVKDSSVDLDDILNRIKGKIEEKNNNKDQYLSDPKPVLKKTETVEAKRQIIKPMKLDKFEESDKERDVNKAMPAVENKQEDEQKIENEKISDDFQDISKMLERIKAKSKEARERLKNVDNPQQQKPKNIIERSERKIENKIIESKVESKVENKEENDTDSISEMLEKIKARAKEKQQERPEIKTKEVKSVEIKSEQIKPAPVFKEPVKIMEKQKQSTQVINEQKISQDKPVTVQTEKVNIQNKPIVKEEKKEVYSPPKLFKEEKKEDNFSIDDVEKKFAEKLKKQEAEDSEKIISVNDIKLDSNQVDASLNEVKNSVAVLDKNPNGINSNLAEKGHENMNKEQQVHQSQKQHNKPQVQPQQKSSGKKNKGNNAIFLLTSDMIIDKKEIEAKEKKNPLAEQFTNKEILKLSAALAEVISEDCSVKYLRNKIENSLNRTLKAKIEEL